MSEVLQWYLTKADTREGKYACAKEDANMQRKMWKRKERCKYARIGIMAVWKTTKGELQTENCKGQRVLMIIDGNIQT